MVVSVPHFGIEPLPGVGAEHYREPGYDTFPRGYTDAFAAEVYGDLHHAGASLVATPYSRLFVDVNRRRDDFERRGGEIVSGRGVVRTHVLRGPADLRASRWDPRRDRGSGCAGSTTRTTRRSTCWSRRRQARFGAVVVLDAHTASPRRMGDHEVVIGSRRGETAGPAPRGRGGGAVPGARPIVPSATSPATAGGYITRRFGRRSARTTRTRSRSRSTRASSCRRRSRSTVSGCASDALRSRTPKPWIGRDGAWRTWFGDSPGWSRTWMPCRRTSRRHEGRASGATRFLGNRAGDLCGATGIDDCCGQA